jgi:outer membrane protein assembly factor BamA
MGLVLKAGLTDVFEDYKLSGGALINSDLTNNQYYLMYEYLRKRWDQRYIIHQQRRRDQDMLNLYRTNTLEGIASFSYPFNRYQSLRLAGIYRRDVRETLGTDRPQLEAPQSITQWAGARVEFVQDNTTELAINTLRGTRWKFYVEAYKNLNREKDYMTVIGLDYRTYLPLYKTLIWANRLAANTSLGSSKVLYVLGGVDNWISPRYDQQLAPPAGENFVFNGVGTNLRGFWQNARNGSNYVLINSEIRFPVLSVISRSPISNEFLRSLTVVGFADGGTAWSGPDPFSLDNPFNVTDFENGPVRVTVVTNKNPLVLGYGFGFRARLFGYFIRADRGWGLDDGQILRPVWYFSLSLDF